MVPDRWQTIEELFDGALRLEPALRGEYLDRQCHGDTGLRGEVESLLEHNDNAGRFLYPPAETSPLEPGDRISHFEVQGMLGEGGMGAVYRAMDTQLHRAVALKVLPSGTVNDPVHRQRLLHEAPAASSLNHSNIVSIYAVGTHEGIDFMAMELVEGQTLADIIPPDGLPLEQAIDYARQIVSGLAKAHASGLVHRDLKPRNVMRTPEGVIKLLDFGLARRLPEDGAPDASLSVEGQIFGTPAYMSPEQAEGKRVDARSDIFSFGALLYEMLSGRKAFAPENRARTLTAVLRDQPAPLGSLRHDVPAML